METATFLFTCVSPDDKELFDYYCNHPTFFRRANKEQKNIIIQNGFFSRFELFRDYHVRAEQLNYQGRKIIVVTHSEINHFFELN